MREKILTCLKNICQVLIGIPEGWFSFWWFLYALAFVTERKDQDAEVIVPLGWTMGIIGVIVILSIEFIMYRWNKNWKIYFLFHLFPCIATALIAYLFLIFL